MNIPVLHAGFDGLRVTVDRRIPDQTRRALHQAKERAAVNGFPTELTLGDMDFLVRPNGGRAFSFHTGEYGAEFYVHDPENPSGQGPAVTIDFRSFLLACKGLAGAEELYNKAIAAFEMINFKGVTKISRVDFAVDVLAPWFVPDVDSVILPARTSKREFGEKDTSERFFANTDVTGITCGHISNRQLVIYDKRAEILAKKKKGWLTIWNQNRLIADEPLLDLKDRNQSRVWRIESRVGSNCLRRRWELKGWSDLEAMIGDVFQESLDKMRYAVPQSDNNRSRWPDHELWGLLRSIYDKRLSSYRSGVVPNDIRTVNRTDHQQLLKQNVYGNLVALAASKDLECADFWQFARDELVELEKRAEEHTTPLSVRFDKAKAKYKFQ